MNKRPGVTLLEVLTAIFIMGIGLLALLTLFPVGASTMSEAMKNSRVTETGLNARSVCNNLNLRQDPNVTPSFTLNAGYNTAYGLTAGTTLPLDWNGASFPVFVDAIGVNYIGYGANSTITGSLIPRVSFTQGSTASTALRWCSLWDDYTFDNTGSAALATGATRESRFTYAYMMRQPNALNPAVVDVNVVCYAGRNLQIAGGETGYPQAGYAVTYSYGSPRTITLTYTGDKPNLKRGGWILDSTTNDPVKNRTVAQQFGPIQGYFYRVVDFTEVNANQIEIELQNVPVAPISSIVIMDNVAEVFPIGTGRP